MRCRSCGFENPVGAKFCNRCGYSLSVSCSRCGREHGLAATLCEGCGESLTVIDSPSVASAGQRSGASTPALNPAASALRSERKIVTALFADIKGSMELLEGLDPEDAHQIIDPALRLMIDSVQRHDGYIVQSTGDGIFAIFGAPLADEYHAHNGIRAALAMQEQVRRYAAKLLGRLGFELQIRVGLNTGEVVVRLLRTSESQTEYAPIGFSTSVAARMQTMARSGCVVVTEETRRLTNDEFEFRELGQQTVKGASQAIEAFEVTGFRPLRSRFEAVARRGLVKFVGRERELELLQRALTHARDGHGQIVALVAEAGGGKSRLFYEFKRGIDPECLVLESFSLAHGSASAYQPLLEFLRHYFEILPEEDETGRRDKVRQAVARLGPDLEDTLPYLDSILGIAGPVDPLRQMDPSIKQERTIAAMRRLILRHSAKVPLILIFEDLHWFDAYSDSFVKAMADSVVDVHILMLVNYRPEYRPAWSRVSVNSELRLEPLMVGEAGEMLDSLLGDAPELAALKRRIVEKADGNPFFIEEIVQNLFDHGVLMRNGVAKLTQPAAQIEIPTTVRAVLASRIDRQPPVLKDFLQTLAVIGKEFPHRLVARTTGFLDQELDAYLAELRSAEFISVQRSMPEPTYSFKHALTQEVAYRSLLTERRTLLHGRVGEALETVYANHLEDHLAELARHFRLSNDAAKAITYSRLAGEQANRRGANAEALELLSAVLQLVAKQPDGPDRARRELETMVVVTSVLVATKGYAAPELEEPLDRMLWLCGRIDDPQLSFFVQFYSWLFASVRGEHVQRAFELSNQLMAMAERLANTTLIVWANVARGCSDYHVGQMATAGQHLEKAIELDDPAPRVSGAFEEPAALAGAYLGPTLWYLGYPDRAVTAGYAAIEHARTKNDPFSQAHATFFTAAVMQLRREPKAAMRLCEATISLATDHGFPLWLGQGQMWRGWSLSHLGHPQEGIDQLAAGIATYANTGARLGTTYWAGLRAETYLQAGEYRKALASASEVADLVAYGGERIYEGELYRLKGVALLHVDPTAVNEAETAFRTAVDIARKTSTKSWELRAVTSLASLLKVQKRRSEGRGLLAEVYGWFAEGFETADLKDARGLLEELD